MRHNPQDAQRHTFCCWTCWDIDVELRHGRRSVQILSKTLDRWRILALLQHCPFAQTKTKGPGVCPSPEYPLYTTFEAVGLGPGSGTDPKVLEHAPPPWPWENVTAKNYPFRSCLSRNWDTRRAPAQAGSSPGAPLPQRNSHFCRCELCLQTSHKKLLL